MWKENENLSLSPLRTIAITLKEQNKRKKQRNYNKNVAKKIKSDYFSRSHRKSPIFAIGIISYFRGSNNIFVDKNFKTIYKNH